MKKHITLAAFLTCVLSLPPALTAPVAAQQQTPAPASSASPQQTPTATQRGQSSTDAIDDEVVQITTNLVQLDAVVTDRKGRQITDLRAEDFEIFENNELQPITNFSYVALAPEPAATTAPASPANRPTVADKLAPPTPPVRLRPEQVRRTIALVVDDLGLSFESMSSVRQALRKYVDQQMSPNDLVAIIRTSAGVGALQQFTADKRQLYSAIERVRWYPAGRSGISAFAPISSFEVAARGADEAARRRVGRENGALGASNAGADLDEFRDEIFSVGTLGALNYVVRGLRELPGRKGVVLFSDGLPLFDRDSAEDGGRTEANSKIFNAMRRLIDLANRASVVVYTIDARGLQVLGLTAEDDVNGLSLVQIESRLSDRRAAFSDTQDGLNYLAQQTGGIALRNTNDLSSGIRRALEDQKGFYLIGYRPSEKTFDRVTGQRRFNKFTIKLKGRTDLRVRTRSGFYGVPSEDVRSPARRTRAEQIVYALRSPFANSGVNLRLTSIFGNESQVGSFVRSMLHIDASALTFTQEADGWRKAIVDVVAFTYDGEGKVVDTVNRTETMQVRAEAYEQLQRDGVLYVINVPVKKAGAYQLRVAVRDAKSERTGSASQFIEVPNISNKRLALSGLMVASYSNAEQQQANAVSRDKASVAAPQTSPAVRRFVQGAALEYSYQIYNAILDHATARGQLQTQVRIFRDGQQIYAGKPVNYDASGQPDPQRLSVGGRLQLGAAMPVGEYVIQAVVTDLLAKEKRRTVTQWIDFEIVK
jgi:VWFA-related protein